jgi:hypothetical protein
VSERPTPIGGEPSPQRPVRSPAGGISVITTERGLPTHLKIVAAEMSRAPEDLACEILWLCQLSAMRLQVARRRDLMERGFSPAVIRDLKLATEEALAKAEEQAQGHDDGPPQTWMRSL